METGKRIFDFHLLLRSFDNIFFLKTKMSANTSARGDVDWEEGQLFWFLFDLVPLAILLFMFLFGLPVLDFL